MNDKVEDRVLPQAGVQGDFDHPTRDVEAQLQEPLPTPHTMPSHEETLARHADPYERAKAEQRQREVMPRAEQQLESQIPPGSVLEVRGIYAQPPAHSDKVMNDKEFEAAMSAAMEHAQIGSPDAGARARELMNAHQVRKKAQRRKRIKFWTGWVVFFLLVAAVAVAIWSILPKYVVSGRYTVTSECTAELGKTTLTGKREYSYGYKSLFGYHLVDESTALERTVVDITGDRLTILGWDKATGKTWRQNIGSGERGIAILKHADLYWFLSDKEMATVPYSAFCK